MAHSSEELVRRARMADSVRPAEWPRAGALRARGRAAEGAKALKDRKRLAGKGERRWPRSAPARLFLGSKRLSFRAGIDD